MRTLLLTTSAAMLCGLSGCGLPLPVLAKAPNAYHDVSYYDFNTLERDQTKAWCANNPGLAVKVPSCASAVQSDIHAWNRQMGWIR